MASSPKGGLSGRGHTGNIAGWKIRSISTSRRVNWQDEWQLDPTANEASGGQASVAKVFRIVDKAPGALKRLHPNNIGVTERRFRMKEQADALNALEAKGGPK